jgi:membrane protein
VHSEGGPVSTAVRRLILAGSAAAVAAGTAAAVRARRRAPAAALPPGPPVRPVSPPGPTHVAEPSPIPVPPAPAAEAPLASVPDAEVVGPEDDRVGDPEPVRAERTPDPEPEPEAGAIAMQRAAKPEEQEEDTRESTSPADIPGTGRMAVLKRTFKEFQEDNITDWAAALTYYAVLALFPAMLVLVALLGIFGQFPQTTNALLDIVRQVSGDQEGLDGLENTINGVVQSKGGAGALLGIGLVTALWSASGYIGAFMRASNAIYEIPEGRQFWKLRPLQVIVTLTMVMLVALLAISLVTTGPVAEAVGDQIGLGDEFVTIYGIAKWPLMALIVLCMLAVLYYSAPNAQLPKFRWITPGAVLALVIWIIASAAFGFYVANFGSYNKTYGTLGGAISLLVWLWITNIAVLLGQELNAEVERGRELSAGLPAAREIQLPPRTAPKKDPEDEGEEISREGGFRPNRAEQSSGRT